MSWERGLRLAAALVHDHTEPQAVRIEKVEVRRDSVHVEFDNGMSSVLPTTKPTREDEDYSHWNGPAPACGFCGGTGMGGGRTYAQASCCFQGYCHNTCLDFWQALWWGDPKPQRLPPEKARRAIAERKNRCERNGAQRPMDRCST